MCCTLMHAWSFRLIYNVLLDYFTFKVKYILKSGSSWVYHSMGCKDGGRTHLSLSLIFLFYLLLLFVNSVDCEPDFNFFPWWEQQNLCCYRPVLFCTFMSSFKYNRWLSAPLWTHENIKQMLFCSCIVSSGCSAAKPCHHHGALLEKCLNYLFRSLLVIKSVKSNVGRKTQSGYSSNPSWLNTVSTNEALNSINGWVQQRV